LAESFKKSPEYIVELISRRKTSPVMYLRKPNFVKQRLTTISEEVEEQSAL